MDRLLSDVSFRLRALLGLPPPVRVIKPKADSSPLPSSSSASSASSSASSSSSSVSWRRGSMLVGFCLVVSFLLDGQVGRQLSGLGGGVLSLLPILPGLEPVPTWGVETGRNDPFGSDSDFACFGDSRVESRTCVFRNLYLFNGRLHYVVDGKAVQPSDVRLPTVHLGAPKHADNPWSGHVPKTITQADLKSMVSATDPSLLKIHDPPVFYFQRLNPMNIYHHLWDDVMTAFTAIAEAYPARLRPGQGPADLQIVFTDGYGFSGPADDAWKAVSSWPVKDARHFLGQGAEGKVIMVRALAAGSQGRCTHRRHCAVDMSAAQVKAFRAHMLAHYGIVSVLPKKPTAILIARAKRRMFVNILEIEEVIRGLGYETRIIGPFEGTPLKEQLADIANASLAVFLHGAELGNAWMGLPEGACASVIFPFHFSDTISWWVADKLGIRVAPYFDVPSMEGDPRLAAPILEEQESLRNYNADVTVVPWLLRNSIWCGKHPDFISEGV